MCQRLENAEDVVWQFPHGVAVLGPWQFYHGYCVLMARQHATELFTLDPQVRHDYLEEMCLLARAIYEVFQPIKINYELLGNQVPHLHWHLFPRYAADPDRLSPAWIALERSEKDASLRQHLTTGLQDRPTTIALLRRHLTQLGAPTA
jgi:diadenosine tetraphosphate (Ap4A) HIT family hydrolase